jgi:flagellin
MSGIVLSSAVRTNLTTLQSTTALQGKIQEKLSSGKKVNSALDNVSSFFTASGLNRRANDLSGLLDSMQQGVETLQAADNAMKAITKNVESMQANIRQARADKSFKSESFTVASNATGNLSFTAGSVTGTVNVATATQRAVLTGGVYAALDFRGDGVDTIANTADDTNGSLSFDLAVNGGTATNVSIASTSDTNLTITVGTTTVATNAVANADAVSANELRDALNAGLNAANAGVTASVAGGAIVFTANADKGVEPGTGTVTVTNAAVGGSGGVGLTTTNFGFNVAGTLTQIAGPAKTVDQLVSTINNNGGLAGKVKASNDGGKLKIENLSTESLTVGGINAVNGEIQGTAGLGTKSIGGNDVRKGLINQFNDLRKQLDRLSDDL